MELKKLEEACACYDARVWFEEHFKQSAPTADVLFKAFEEEYYSWIEWYLEEEVENMVLPEGESQQHMEATIIDKLDSSTDPLALLRQYYPPPKKAKAVKKAPKKPVVKAKVKKTVKKRA